MNDIICLSIHRKLKHVMVLNTHLKHNDEAH